jgi:hypothetical protein
VSESGPSRLPEIFLNIWIFNPYKPLPTKGSIRLRHTCLGEALIGQVHKTSSGRAIGVVCSNNGGVYYLSAVLR